ncbi:MAG: TolC family protein [Leptospirales bacterium]|nr:TolC family protein [Leptospirales bacterium]
MKRAITYVLILFLPLSYRMNAGQNQPIELDLETAVQIGTTNHFAVQAAKNKQLAVHRLITERWLTYLPTPGLSYRRTSTVQTGAADSGSAEVRFTLEQVIYDGGKRSLDLDLAKIEALLASQEFRVAYNQVRLEVERAFFKVLAAKGKVLLNSKSLERVQIQLKEAKREETLGFATRVQVLTVAARVREIELALSQARHEHTHALQNFKLALNLDYNAEISVKGDLFYDYFLHPPVADLESLVQSGNANRPEITKAQAEVHRLNKEQQIATDSWIPRVSIEGYAGRTENHLNNPPMNPEWGVNLRLTFPIQSATVSTTTGSDYVPRRSISNSDQTQIKFFDDISYDRRVLERRIALGQGIQDYRAVTNRIPIEITQSRDRLLEAWEAIRLGNGRTFFQFEALRLAETRRGVGELKRSDIVLQEAELVRAQQDLNDAVAAYLIASYELEYNSGKDPGALQLIEHLPGRGNTILPYLVRPIRNPAQIPQNHRGDPVWEIDRIDEKDKADNKKSDQFQIDRPEKKN